MLPVGAAVAMVAVRVIAGNVVDAGAAVCVAESVVTAGGVWVMNVK